MAVVDAARNLQVRPIKRRNFVTSSSSSGAGSNSSSSSTKLCQNNFECTSSLKYYVVLHKKNYVFNISNMAILFHIPRWKMDLKIFIVLTT
jgi:hypothetical protein